MIMTKLKWVAIALVASGVLARGTIVRTLRADGAGSEASRVEKQPGPTGPGPLAEVPPRASTPPAAVAPDQLRDELALLAVQLAKKKAGLEEAHAIVTLAKAVVATNRRLNAKKQGIVSEEEMCKAECEVRVAEARVKLAEADVREVELHMDYARRRRGHPERQVDLLDRARDPGSPAALEGRMKALERKVDLILELLTQGRIVPGK
jgi:hypothetical protein